MKKPEYKELFYKKDLAEAIGSLEKLMHLIGDFQMKKSAVWTGEVMDIARDYLIGATLWDITVFGNIMKLISGKYEALLTVYEFVGEIDMEISVASFRQSLPCYCRPKFTDEKQLTMIKLYHPLLIDPVSNDWIFRKNCLITGANASGKSTFIKAVAVNVILAQSIYTCMAESFCLAPFLVLTSMAVRDDILAGESYYIREANNLKRIVDAAKEGKMALCLMDEILRGTNTQERLAASRAVLKFLTGKNCLIAAATHDLELADMLREEYQCYHFETAMGEHDILFDYKIRTGPGNSRNAVRLLRSLSFPEEIVAMAHERMMC